MSNISSDRVGFGRNPDLGSYRDDRYVRCSKCGFINNLDRALRGQEGSRQGYGVALVHDILVDDPNVQVDSSNTTSASILYQNVHFDGYFIGGSSVTVATNSSYGTTYMTGEGTQRATDTQGCALCGTLLYWR